jgi:hypothetical protein
LVVESDNANKAKINTINGKASRLLNSARHFGSAEANNSADGRASARLQLA